MKSYQEQVVGMPAFESRMRAVSWRAVSNFLHPGLTIVSRWVDARMELTEFDVSMISYPDTPHTDD